ncbi:TetR family transcriptional regulator [Mycobacterium sp. Root265]|uniref:TetR/AcrR family transcriptional regulator n=1 Tax=Mycobacterium sp. Root265 TaxID=1736504 RepID=UPI00070954B6|nr:TetR/AcrR family transcriptional regulator [Mycobacterium sp. Root265]KRD20686.1 TetR family transcriptional regulator [Mycobacterium sp. Root265]
MRSSGSTFTERARREQIVAGAIETIATKGYTQASLAKIAEHVGIAKSVVLYHFTSKTDIIEAVVAAVFGQAAAIIAPAVAAESTARDKLAAYIRANVQFIQDSRLAAVAMLEIVTSFRTEDGLRLDQAAARSGPPSGELTMLDPLALITDGINSGEFRTMSAVFTKNALRAALDGAVWEVARDPAYDVIGYGEQLVTMFDLATRAQS